MWYLRERTIPKFLAQDVSFVCYDGEDCGQSRFLEEGHQFSLGYVEFEGSKRYHPEIAVGRLNFAEACSFEFLFMRSLGGQLTVCLKLFLSYLHF